jgi:mannitol-specific phosphotransferase system IIBC component
LKRLWEGLVEFAANVLENDEKGQVAARIPFSGTIKDPQAGILATIVSVVHNAFVSAFARSLEGSISLRDVKKNLQGIGEDTSQQKDKDKKRTASKEKDKDEDQEKDKRKRGSRRPT